MSHRYVLPLASAAPISPPGTNPAETTPSPPGSASRPARVSLAAVLPEVGRLAAPLPVECVPAPGEPCDAGTTSIAATVPARISTAPAATATRGYQRRR